MISVQIIYLACFKRLFLLLYIVNAPLRRIPPLACSGSCNYGFVIRSYEQFCLTICVARIFYRKPVTSLCYMTTKRSPRELCIAMH